MTEGRWDWRASALVAAVLGMVVLVLVVRLRRLVSTAVVVPGRRGFADDTGGITPFDLTLTAPIFIFLSILFFQFALLLKDEMVVLHAAAAAARSARVNLCPPIPAGRTELVQRLLGLWPCGNDREKAVLAARYVLVAVSPTSYDAACEGNCAPPDGLDRRLATATRTTVASKGWARQLRYAFDPANVEVDVGPVWGYLAEGLISGQIPIPPFRAEVRFHDTLLPAMSGIFGKGRHRDGRAFTILTAEATIL